MTDDLWLAFPEPDDRRLEFSPAIRLFDEHGDPEEDPQGWSTVTTNSGGNWADNQVGAEIVWTVVRLTVA